MISIQASAPEPASIPRAAADLVIAITWALVRASLRVTFEAVDAHSHAVTVEPSPLAGVALRAHALALRWFS